MNMVVHPDVVQMAHQYGCAAAKQKKFIEYKRAFWDKAWPPYAASGGRDQSSMGEPAILKWLGEIGIDATKAKADANAAECAHRIDADQTELQKFHVNGTPNFFINGKHIAGGLPKSEFKQIIDEKLAIAEKSGVPGADYYEREIFAKGEKKFRSKADAKHK